MLRSAMFAGYNNSNDAKVRIGSWREELALKELTGVTRVANPKNKAVYNSTGVRVLFHANSAEAEDSGRSTAEVSFVDPMTVPGAINRLMEDKPGPRTEQAKKALTAIVEAEEAARARASEEAESKGDFDTTFRQSFKRYSDEAFRTAKSKSCNPRSESSVQRIEIPDTRDREDIPLKQSELGLHSTGTTVIVWNSPDIAPNQAAASGAFGRKCRFTEAGTQPFIAQPIFPDPGPRNPSMPIGLSDSEASSLAFLKRRVVERARENALPSIRRLWRLLWPRAYREVVGKIGSKELREGMAEFKVPMTPFEQWVITTAFDTDDNGQISLDKIIHFFRDGPLSTSRQETIRGCFHRLDPHDTGIVTLDRLREACAFKRCPAVQDGKASEEDVKTLFLDHFETHPKRSERENPRTITIETFMDAFRDIASACIDPSTIQPFCLNGTSKSDRYKDCLFESVVACVG